MTAGLQLGAPGVYRAPARVDISFRPVRLDVAGFVGVAPRGPVDQPVLVQSWTDYQLRFGQFEGPGLLPYAVSAFFEQGGVRAYVVRVRPVANRGAGYQGRAQHRLELTPATAEPGTAGFVEFVASNEGSWGNRLVLRLELAAAQQFTATVNGGGLEMWLPGGVDVPIGSLLRFRGAGLAALGEFRFVQRVERREIAPGRRRRLAVLDRPVPAGPGFTVAVVTATLVVDDGDRAVPRGERIADLGLHPGHRRFLASVVSEQSLLVQPVGDWIEHPVVLTDPLLPAVASVPLTEVTDGYEQLDARSFFDGRPDQPFDADPFDERDHHGVDKLVREPELGLLLVPDLMWSWVTDEERIEFAPSAVDAGFQPCPAPSPPDKYEPPRPRMHPLDGRIPDELDEIVARQRRLAALAERYQRFVVLLDVPSRLEVRAIGQWRAEFSGSYAAAYHPWLSVNSSELVRTGLRRAVGTRVETVTVPPSAFAAGIIAAREQRFGLPWGPANELAEGAVLATQLVTDAEHNVLHQLGVNVYRAERDGFRLSAARTLSADPSYRQLNVRRLMTMLRLTLSRQAQWVVFEPNNRQLRTLLHRHIVAFLRELYRGGAFAGDSEEDAFFVRSDDTVNPQASLDLGRLVFEVGVAPAEPLEFLVLRVSRDGDGGVRVTESDDDLA